MSGPLRPPPWPSPSRRRQGYGGQAGGGDLNRESQGACTGMRALEMDSLQEVFQEVTGQISAKNSI